MTRAAEAELHRRWAEKAVRELDATLIQLEEAMVCVSEVETRAGKSTLTLTHALDAYARVIRKARRSMQKYPKRGAHDAPRSAFDLAAVPQALPGRGHPHRPDRETAGVEPAKGLPPKRRTVQTGLRGGPWADAYPLGGGHHDAPLSKAFFLAGPGRKARDRGVRTGGSICPRRMGAPRKCFAPRPPTPIRPNRSKPAPRPAGPDSNSPAVYTDAGIDSDIS